MAFTTGRVLGRWGRPTVLPFGAIGIVASRRVGAIFAVFRVTEPDDELALGREALGQGADLAALDCNSGCVSVLVVAGLVY